LSALSVVAGKDQRVENGLGPTGLSGFMIISLVAVVRPNILPKPYPLRDILDQSAFIDGRTLLGERGAEGRPRESVG
jgi:hypothetical protein